MQTAVLQEINNQYVYGLVAGNTVKIGDIVCITADETVSISTTAATHANRIGVVVGGRGTNNIIVPQHDTNCIGMTAATVGQEVIVLVRGVCYVVCAAAIAAGLPLVPDTTTAGRVKAATDYTLNAGATAVTSSAANGAIISGEGLNKHVGRLLAASSAGGDKRLAYINC